MGRDGEGGLEVDLELEVGGGLRAVEEAALRVEALVSAVGQNPLYELDCAGG